MFAQPPQYVVRPPAVVSQLLQTYGPWNVIAVRLCYDHQTLTFLLQLNIQVPPQPPDVPPMFPYSNLTVMWSKRDRVFSIELISFPKEFHTCLVIPVPEPRVSPMMMMSAMVPQGLSLYQMVERAKQTIGEYAMWVSAPNLAWVMNLLSANGLSSPEVQRFIQTTQQREQVDNPVRTTIERAKRQKGTVMYLLPEK